VINTSISALKLAYKSGELTPEHVLENIKQKVNHPILTLYGGYRLR